MLQFVMTFYRWLFVAVHNDMLQGGSVLQYIMACYKMALCCST